MSASPASEEVYPSAHITENSLLIPTIKAWRYYLDDQAMSPHTIKAFSGDLQLLAGYLPPDRLLGDITNSDLVNFLEWLDKGRGIPCSPKTLARRTTSIKAFFLAAQKASC
jgi:integrase/recombinase XerD